MTPSVEEVRDRLVTGTRRVAKQLVLALDPDLFVVVHLMISGRLRWYERGRAVPKRGGLAAFDFSSGTLIFTEASKKKRASLRLVHGEEGLGDSTRAASKCWTSTCPRSSNACAARGTR